MGVQGFPTLKIVKPAKPSVDAKTGKAKKGKVTVEDYQGPRTAKGIVDAVVDKIPNHVVKVTDKDLDDFVSGGGAKAILFTEKGTTSALYRALAVDFLGSISFAQIRSKESQAVEKYGVTSFPTLILLPARAEEALVYDGEMKKESMSTFLSQVAAPNPDPAPKKAKAKSTTKSFPSKSTDAAKASSFSASSAAHKSADARASMTHEDFDDSETIELVFGDNGPIVKPKVDQEPVAAKVPDAPVPIPTLATPEELRATCLGPKSSVCFLALLPAPATADSELPEKATAALAALSQVKKKRSNPKSPLNIYAVPALNSGAAQLRSDLGLEADSEIEFVAINARRGWYRVFGPPFEITAVDVEGWIDQVRHGEGKKLTLPEGVVEKEKKHEVVEQEMEEVVIEIDQDGEIVMPKAGHDHDEL